METLLEYEVTYHPVVDLVRAVVFFLGAFIVVYSAREALLWPRRRRHTKAEMALCVCLATFGVYLMLQEVERWGDPMLWWRIPLLAFAAVNGVIGVRSLHHPD